MSLTPDQSIIIFLHLRNLSQAKHESTQAFALQDEYKYIHTYTYMYAYVLQHIQNVSIFTYQNIQEDMDGLVYLAGKNNAVNAKRLFGALRRTSGHSKSTSFLPLNMNETYADLLLSLPKECFKEVHHITHTDSQAQDMSCCFWQLKTQATLQWQTPES